MYICKVANNRNNRNNHPCENNFVVSRITSSMRIFAKHYTTAKNGEFCDYEASCGFVVNAIPFINTLEVV